MQSCDPNVRPTPRTLGAVVSDDVEHILARALAVNPEGRFLNVREFWDALSAALVMQETADIEVTWDVEESSAEAWARSSDEPSLIPSSSEPSLIPSSGEPSGSPSLPDSTELLTSTVNRLRDGASFIHTAEELQ
jgi:hypothetical protein